ncbi:MAG: hypothetical protein SW833_09000 [Cyanobacteriota bacterium]|nr:hypothetical protein [Cyanobacteriota bacterium]
MYDRPRNYQLADDFRRERSVRRAVTVLETKRRRIRDDIEQLISQISLLMPPSSGDRETSALLEDAAERLGDEAFVQLLRQVWQEGR